MTTILATPPQTLPENVQALCTPYTYPEIGELYYHSPDYQKRKSDEEDDFVIYGTDPIEVSYDNGDKWYIRITLLTLNGFSRAKWYQQVKFRKEKAIDAAGSGRIDTLANIKIRVTIPELTGYFMCSILDAKGKSYNTLTESFRYKVTNLDFEMEMTIKEIDEPFRKPNFKYRTPDIRFQYDFEDLTVKVSPRPDIPTETGKPDHDRLILHMVLFDFIEQKLKLSKDEMAVRLARNIFIKVSPYVVKTCQSEVDIGIVFRAVFLNHATRSTYTYETDTTEPIQKQLAAYGKMYSSIFKERAFGPSGDTIKLYLTLPFFSGMYLSWNDPAPRLMCSEFFAIFDEL